jgi:hypothetical protein
MRKAFFSILNNGSGGGRNIINTPIVSTLQAAVITEFQKVIEPALQLVFSCLELMFATILIKG